MHWLARRLLGGGDDAVRARQQPVPPSDRDGGISRAVDPQAGPDSFAAFCEVFEKAQSLRKYVASNYVGFIKSMKKFEKKTGVRVAYIFMPRLLRSLFFRSAGADLGISINLYFGCEMPP
eukprot:SAG31_NODE_2065_length_6530_cov_22.048515_5_plen_120_part_00